MFLPFLTYCLTCLTAVLSALQLCSLSSNFFWSLHHLIREATLRGIMDPSYVLQLWKIPFDIQTAFISPCLRWESVSWRRRNCVDCADEMGYQHEPHTAAGSALWFKSVSGGMGVWLGSSRKGNWILPLEKTVLESVSEAFEAWACGFQSYETAASLWKGPSSVRNWANRQPSELPRWEPKAPHQGQGHHQKWP